MCVCACASRKVYMQPKCIRIRFHRYSVIFRRKRTQRIAFRRLKPLKRRIFRRNVSRAAFSPGTAGYDNGKCKYSPNRLIVRNYNSETLGNRKVQSLLAWHQPLIADSFAKNGFAVSAPRNKTKRHNNTSSARDVFARNFRSSLRTVSNSFSRLSVNFLTAFARAEAGQRNAGRELNASVLFSAKPQKRNERKRAVNDPFEKPSKLSRPIDRNAYSVFNTRGQ